MSNWVLYGPLAFKAKLPSALVNDIDTFLTKVPNFSDGSTHTAASQVTLAGAGLRVTGAFEADSAQITITTGKTLTVNASATLVTNATSTTTINGTLTVNSVGTFTKGLAVTQSTANTQAIEAFGNGTGAALVAEGGATGPGLTAVSGTAQTNTAPTCAAEFAGYIQLTGADPNQGVDPGANNVLHAMAIPKALCNVVLSGGSPYTPLGSLNVDTVEDTVNTAEYKVTLKRKMATGVYFPQISVRTVGYGAAVVGMNDTDFTFRVYKTSDLAPTTGQTVIITVSGAQ